MERRYACNFKGGLGSYSFVRLFGQLLFACEAAMYVQLKTMGVKSSPLTALHRSCLYDLSFILWRCLLCEFIIFARNAMILYRRYTLWNHLLQLYTDHFRNFIAVFFFFFFFFYMEGSYADGFVLSFSYFSPFSGLLGFVIFRQWVLCEIISFCIFTLIVFKLSRCFVHGMNVFLCNFSIILSNV